MNRHACDLNGILRLELTAVNQQFIHILALRHWGDHEAAARIYEVDLIDFPNAMKLIDLLVTNGPPIQLLADDSVPGLNRREILRAEQASERRLLAAIDSVSCEDERAKTLLATARGPREAYAAWLAAQLAATGDEDPARASPFPATERVFAQLLTVIEQSMVHAFVHWHAGKRDLADAAWATSGAAMMQATALVNLFAARLATPQPRDAIAPQVSSESETALACDSQLAAVCAHEAAEAETKCGTGEAAKLCRDIADHSRRIADWRPGESHPTEGRIPVAFKGFAATRSKFLR